MSKKQIIIDGINDGKSFESIVLESDAKESYVKKIFTEQGIDWEDSDDPEVELKTIIVEVEDEKESVEIESNKISYTKTRKNPFFVCGVEINEGFTPSSSDLKKKDFIKKLNYAVKLGLLKQG